MTDEDAERLRYAGATTKHDGPGDKPQKMGSASVDDLLSATDDPLPSVAPDGDAEEETSTGQ